MLVFFRTYTFSNKSTCFLCQVRSGGPTICDETQHVTAIIETQHVTVIIETHHVTVIIDVDGAPSLLLSNPVTAQQVDIYNQN